MTPETPRTDALWAHLSQHGWGREHLPCSTIMESHEKLELELAAERALVDRLAGELQWWGDYCGDNAPASIDLTLAAWKEARRGTD